MRDERCCDRHGRTVPGTAPLSLPVGKAVTILHKEYAFMVLEYFALITFYLVMFPVCMHVPTLPGIVQVLKGSGF